MATINFCDLPLPVQEQFREILAQGSGGSHYWVNEKGYCMSTKDLMEFRWRLPSFSFIGREVMGVAEECEWGPNKLDLGVPVALQMSGTHQERIARERYGRGVRGREQRREEQTRKEKQVRDKEVRSPVVAFEGMMPDMQSPTFLTEEVLGVIMDLADNYQKARHPYAAACTQLMELLSGLIFPDLCSFSDLSLVHRSDIRGMASDAEPVAKEALACSEVALGDMGLLVPETVADLPCAVLARLDKDLEEPTQASLSVFKAPKFRKPPHKIVKPGGSQRGRRGIGKTGRALLSAFTEAFATVPDLLRAVRGQPPAPKSNGVPADMVGWDKDGPIYDIPEDDARADEFNYMASKSGLSPGAFLKLMVSASAERPVGRSASFAPTVMMASGGADEWERQQRRERERAETRERYRRMRIQDEERRGIEEEERRRRSISDWEKLSEKEQKWRNKKFSGPLSEADVIVDTGSVDETPAEVVVETPTQEAVREDRILAKGGAGVPPMEAGPDVDAAVVTDQVESSVPVEVANAADPVAMKETASEIA